MTNSKKTTRTNWLVQLMRVLLGLFFLKAIVTILGQYSLYIPPNFQSSEFLSGRESYFWGAYSIAFFTHIIAGPICLCLVVLLMLTSQRKRWRTVHRISGRVLGVLVIGALAPSGAVMAIHSFGGPIAGVAFGTLALATAVAMLLTIHFARLRKFQSHQRWSQRCFVLLMSPILLRLMGGVTISWQVDSPWTYQILAWISWFVPLLLLEVYYLYRGRITIIERSNGTNTVSTILDLPLLTQTLNHE